MFNYTRLLSVATKQLNWIRQYQTLRYPIAVYNSCIPNNEWITGSFHRSLIPQVTILRTYAKSKDKKKEKGLSERLNIYYTL